MSELARFQDRFGQMLDDNASVSDTALHRALAIHRNTTAKAARDALGASYPVVAAIVGEDPFLFCADAFVRAAPPADPWLFDYGEDFASFAGTWHPFAELPYLHGVARTERMVTEARFAADAARLDPAAVARKIDPAIKLKVHPSVRSFTSSWPAASLWLAHQEKAPVDALRTIRWQSEHILVARPRQTVMVWSIDESTKAFLSGDTLGKAAIAATSVGGDVAAVFAFLLTAGIYIDGDV